MERKNRRLIAILCGIALILLIPFTAMQFTNEVNWSAGDFVVAAGLLLGTGLACELALRKMKSKSLRAGIVGIILVAAVLIWAELAVGIFNTPLAGH